TQGLSVDRDTAGLLREFFHLPPGPFPQALEAALKADPDLEAKGDNLNPPFDSDPRDTATPKAMADLLDRIFTGKALSASSTKLLNEIMERNTTGKARIRGRLPEGTIVAEKNGQIGAALNDVGVITLARGRGAAVRVLPLGQRKKNGAVLR